MPSKKKSKPDSVLNKEFELANLLWGLGGFAIVAILAIGAWLLFRPRAPEDNPSLSLVGTWVFDDVKGVAMDGLHFTDANYFSRWSTNGKPYNIEGAYTLQGKQLTLSISGATWPDGTDMQGAAEITNVDGSSSITIAVHGKSYKLVHRPW